MKIAASTKTVLSVLLAVGLLGAGIPGAHGTGKDPCGLSYSVDGGEFRATPEELFGGEIQLVPGDRLSADLAIRNDRPHPIDVTVKPVVPAPADVLKFGVAGNPTVRLEPREHANFALEARLPTSAGNSSQDRARALSLAISAIEVTSGISQEPEFPDSPQSPDRPEPPDANGEHPPDELGSTGFSGWAVPLALGMAAAGAALYLRSKRHLAQASTPQGESQ
ncbi:hypothetical protein [Glutamicibacter soli]